MVEQGGGQPVDAGGGDGDLALDDADFQPADPGQERAVLVAARDGGLRVADSRAGNTAPVSVTVVRKALEDKPRSSRTIMPSCGERARRLPWVVSPLVRGPKTASITARVPQATRVTRQICG